MRAWIAGCLMLALGGSVWTQQKPGQSSGRESVTVPATIDHNRVIVDGSLTLPDGSAHRVRLWVDNGNPDLYLSRHLATLLGLNVTCGDQECSSPPPAAISIGGMKISPIDLRGAKTPLNPVNTHNVLAPGMNVEINLP